MTVSYWWKCAITFRPSGSEDNINVALSIIKVAHRWFRWMEEEDEMASHMSRGLFRQLDKKGSRNRFENVWPLSKCIGNGH